MNDNSLQYIKTYLKAKLLDVGRILRNGSEIAVTLSPQWGNCILN